MTASKIRLLIRTAILASAICVATMIIQIPLGIGGYANLGDGILLISASLLSPGYAAAAACVGSMLADILSGYVIYAPATFFIKGGMALLVSLISAKHVHPKDASASARVILFFAYAAAELFMAAGYFVYEAAVLSYGMGALASVPGNLAQGAVSVGVALLLGSVRHMLEKTR